MALTPFKQNLGGSTQPGRPIKQSSLIVLEMPDNRGAFKLSGQPTIPALESVDNNYMKMGEAMPSIFMSHRMSPTGAPEQMRRRRISKGFV